MKLIAGLSASIFLCCLASSFLMHETPTASASDHVIDSLPYSISVPGHYVLSRSFEWTEPCGIAITIEANDVELDLNSKSIRCTSSEPNRECIGIYANCRQNVTIVDGCVDGFFYGILLQDRTVEGNYAPEYGWHNLTRLKITNCTFRGIRAEGLYIDIEGNLVANTGGTTRHKNPYSFGIEVIGAYAVVRKNNILNTFVRESKSEAVGICLATSCDMAVIQGNVVSNTREPETPARSFGIWIGHSRGVCVLDNLIRRCNYGIGSKRASEMDVLRSVMLRCSEPYYEEF